MPYVKSMNYATSFAIKLSTACVLFVKLTMLTKYTVRGQKDKWIPVVRFCIMTHPSLVYFISLEFEFKNI